VRECRLSRAVLSIEEAAFSLRARGTQADAALVTRLASEFYVNDKHSRRQHIAAFDRQRGWNADTARGFSVAAGGAGPEP